MKAAKKKATRLNAEDFVDPSAMRINNWADMMEDEDPLPLHKPVLPSAPKSIRSGSDFDPALLPKEAPFSATITNIHFEAKEDDISQALMPIKVISVVFHSDNGRFTGTGAIEFETIDDLVNGLSSQKMVKGRTFYVQLPNANGDSHGRHRDGGYNSRYGGNDNTSSNWRTNRSEGFSGGAQRQEQIYPPPNNNFESRSFSRGGGGGKGYDDFNRPARNDGFSNRGGNFGDRYDDDRYGNRRRNDDFNRGGGVERNWSRQEMAPLPQPNEDNNWRSGPRAPPREEFTRERREQPRQFNRDRGDSFRSREDYQRPIERRDIVRAPAPEADLYDPQDYSNSGAVHHGGHRDRTHSNAASNDDYDGARSVKSNDDERSKPASSAVQSLVPVLKELLIDQDADNTPVPESYNSIFGSAKPVDTRNRELEIERKLKREAEEAAAAKAAAAEAAAAAKENAEGSAEAESAGGAAPRAERFISNDRRELPPRMERAGQRDGRKSNERGHYEDRGPRRERYDDRPRGGAFRDERPPRYGDSGARGGERRTGGGFDRRDGASGGRRYDREESGGTGHRVYRDREYRPNRDFNRAYSGPNNDYRDENIARTNENYISNNKYDHLDVEYLND